MSHKSQKEYLESARARYPSRNRTGKSAMINEVSDTLGWTRKHTIKALNGQVSLGESALKRGRKLTYGAEEKEVIVNIWKFSEQPCGVLLKQTIPLWIDSYENKYGNLATEVKNKVLSCSPRQLDRITKPHKADTSRKGRRTGRTSHRLKQLVPIKCGPQEVEQPGWFEADTVSHGGGSSSGNFMWSLTLTDIYSGWTELHGLWGNSGSEVCQALRNIEKRIPMELQGFDSDNGSEFLNETLEKYLLERVRKVNWTRSRPYKKNDQAHVEQKNFTHVRQLLGYERFDNMDLVYLVNDLYETAWLPLRNCFTPVHKLIAKKRIGSKVKKIYDAPQTPIDRLLSSNSLNEEAKQSLKDYRSSLDPYDLAESIESKLEKIFAIVNESAILRAEEDHWLKEESTEGVSAVSKASVPPSVAIAPCVSTEASETEKLA